MFPRDHLHRMRSRTPTLPVLIPVRAVGVGKGTFCPRWLVVAWCLLALAGSSIPVSARQLPGQSGGVPEDDPFADELNPFGRGPGTPQQGLPEPPPQKPVRPEPQLPVPFPETTLPGDPAPRRPDRPRVAPRDGMEPSEAARPSPAEQMLIEAEALDHEGKLEAARAKLREAIVLDPKLGTAYLALGVVARRMGDLEGSVDALSMGLDIEPENAEMYLRRGIAWFHLGLHGIALEDFEDAAGMAYDDPRAELWRGLTLMELDRPLEAINAYAAAIRRDRTYMLAYLNRGLAYLQANQPRKAEFDFNQAIRHDPKDVRAWFNRGVAQAHQGRFAEAVTSYAEALKRDPKHGPSLLNIEAAKARVGQSARQR